MMGVMRKDGGKAMAGDKKIARLQTTKLTISTTKICKTSAKCNSN